MTTPTDPRARARSVESAAACISFGVLLTVLVSATVAFLGIVIGFAVTIIGLYSAERLGEHVSRLGFTPPRYRR